MSTFQTTKDYFRQIVTDHIALVGFVHGGIKKLRAEVLSKQEYPLLWLETPFIDLKDNGSATFSKAKAAFVVLVNAPDQHLSEEEEDTKWSEAEDICMQIIARLKKDAKAKLHTVDLSQLDMDPIDPLLIDKCIGWRVEFTLGRTVDICYNPANWN